LLKTLIVDGNPLLQTGLHGVKDYYHKDNHVGAIYHFLNTLKKELIENKFDKIVVFWDGKDNAHFRRKIYPAYKANRVGRLDEDKMKSFNYQKNRVKKYLEELFIRQSEFEKCEADDCIAFYCQNIKDEEVSIMTNDKDLIQLVSENTKVYLLNQKKYFTKGDKVKFKSIKLPIDNLVLSKMIVGDSSDNISGILKFGEKTLIKFFPEVLERKVTIDEILEKSQSINKNKTILNLIEGKNKHKINEESYLNIAKKIIDLKNPLLTGKAKEEILLLVKEDLDPTDRSIKNAIKLMTEDGLINFIPKSDEGWTKFFTPFMLLTKKERKNG